MERFVRHEKLGKGSFGDVWLVESKEDQKVIHFCATAVNLFHTTKTVLCSEADRSSKRRTANQKHGE